MHELTTLKVGGCPQLTEMGIQRIINTFQYLEEIDISGCHRLSNTAIAMLLSSYSSLRLLKASHLPAVDDGAFNNEAENKSDEGGVGLVVQFGNGAGVMSMMGLRGGMWCSITHLHLDSCAITDRTLDVLSRSGLSIEHLSVRWCSNLTLQGVQRFLMSSPSIQSIYVSDLGFATDALSFFAGRVINPSWLDS